MPRWQLLQQKPSLLPHLLAPLIQHQFLLRLLTTTSGTSLDSSQENPNVQRDKPDSGPESDEGDGSTDPKTPKYKVDTFVIKEVDNIWCTGVIHRVVFEKFILLLCETQ
jgi:hypothetical protein